MRSSAVILAAIVSSSVSAAVVAQGLTYQTLTLRDFEIDSESLTAIHKRVEIVGFYTLDGQLDALYGGLGDVAMARQGLGTRPFIPLVTTGASREFKAAMFDCKSSGVWSCQFTVRGIATRCNIVNGFGASRNAACIAVEDGGIYRPPPPTPEQIAQSQAAAEEAQRQRSEQLSNQVNQWESAVEDCLANPPSWSQAKSGFDMAVGDFINRLVDPKRERAKIAEQKALQAHQLYRICTDTHVWPVGASVPDHLPAPIQNVIDQCTQVHDWAFCTSDNPPHAPQ